ncbi:MAG: F-box/WD repeat-containing protein 7-like [Chlamydiales bacterium]|jgi:hypothetical protein|nr:F-box/WD repeat-containing protein 7-like [Chlamydiales bacterium]
MDYWNLMPTEIQLHTLSHLEIPDLLSCRALSRSWKVIVEDSFLWEKIRQKLPFNAHIQSFSDYIHLEENSYALKRQRAFYPQASIEYASFITPLVCNEKLFVAGLGGRVEVWDLKALTTSSQPFGEPIVLRPIDFSSYSPMVADKLWLHRDCLIIWAKWGKEESRFLLPSEVYIWNLASRTLMNHLLFLEEVPIDISTSEHFLLVNFKKRFDLYCLESGKLLHRLPKDIGQLFFISDWGLISTVVSEEKGALIEIWSLENFLLLESFPPGFRVIYLEGDLLILADQRDCELIVWDLKERQQKGVLQVPECIDCFKEYAITGSGSHRLLHVKTKPSKRNISSLSSMIIWDLNTLEQKLEIGSFFQSFEFMDMAGEKMITGVKNALLLRDLNRRRMLCRIELQPGDDLQGDERLFFLAATQNQIVTLSGTLSGEQGRWQRMVKIWNLTVLGEQKEEVLFEEEPALLKKSAL